MSLIELTHHHSPNPLEVVERMASGNDWPFERAGEDEIALVVTGKWTNYQVSFTWMGDIEALHLACAFDIRIPETRIAEVQQLIAMINEQLWIGHFDVWTQNGMVMFRHALVLSGGVAPSGGQCDCQRHSNQKKEEQPHRNLKYDLPKKISAAGAAPLLPAVAIEPQASPHSRWHH